MTGSRSFSEFETDAFLVLFLGSGGTGFSFSAVGLETVSLTCNCVAAGSAGGIGCGATQKNVKTLT